MKREITLEAIAQMAAPRERADIVSASYDPERRKFTIKWADLPPRPLFVLETDDCLTEDQVKVLRRRAEEMVGERCDVIVLAHGLKGKIIPAALLKAD